MRIFLSTLLCLVCLPSFGQRLFMFGGVATGDGSNITNANATTLLGSGTVPLVRGGLGASLVDPNADTLIGWDDTDGAMKFFTVGSGLTYTHSTHTLSAPTGGSGTVTSVALAATGTGLTVSGSPVTTSGTLTISSPSYVVTNNNANVLVQSNKFSIDASHALSLSNLTASLPLFLNSDNTVTQLNVGAGLLLTGNTISTNGQTTAGGGTDSGAWRTNGNNVANGAQTGIWGFTNGNWMQMRMDENGVDGVPVLEFRTVGNNEDVNISMGASNGFASSTEFSCVAIGGVHNSIAAGRTWASLFGGGWNSIGAGGDGAIVVGGMTNVASGRNSFAAGNGAQALNDNSFVWGGIGNKIVATSGSAGDNGKILLAGTALEFTNSNNYRVLFGTTGMGFNNANGVINFTNGSGRYSRIGPFTGPDSGLSIYGTNTGSANDLTSLMDVTGSGTTVNSNLTATGNFTAKTGTFTGAGGSTFSGGFTTVGETNSNWTFGFATVNDSSGRMTNTLNGSGLTNLPIVTSVTIPMGAWFTNSSPDGASLTAASAVPGTNGDTFTFADVATNRILCRFALPWDWNGGTVQAELWSYNTATNSSPASATNVVWGVRAAAIGSKDSVGSITWGTQIVVTNNESWGTYTNTACITRAITVGNTPTSAKEILWDIQRLGSFTGDSVTNAAGISLAGVRVYYQKNTRSDFPTASP